MAAKPLLACRPPPSFRQAARHVKRFDLLEKRLQKAASRTECELVATIPGIGQVLATTILLETGRLIALPVPV